MSEVATGLLESSSGPYNAAQNYHQGSVHAKRVRAGSITGRLRTASDLEESGYISRVEKGALKDLIISGDVGLQAALDKYERGDQSELAIICRSLAGRRQSIDLLENLDLDFGFLANGEDMRFSEGGGDGDEDFHGRPSDLNAPLSEMGGDNSWRLRKASIDGSHFRQGYGYGFDDFVIAPNAEVAIGGGQAHPPLGIAGGGRGGGETAGCGPALSHMPNTRRSSKSTIDPNIFETHSVDMSAYAAHAHQLQGEAPLRQGRSAYNGGTRSSVSSSLKKAAAAAAELSGSILTHQSSKSIDMFSVAGVGALWGKTADMKFPSGLSDLLFSSFSPPFPHCRPPPSFPLPLPRATDQGYVGAYSPEQRKKRIERFVEKRSRRVWTKKVKYDVRKNFADSRLRVKGRFVKKEDEEMMRDLIVNPFA